MKIVINTNYGGFSLTDEFRKAYNISEELRDDDIERTDERLVEWVEKNPDDNEDLEVVEVSDDCTDYTIQEYDGCETLIYVVDGKLCYD